MASSSWTIQLLTPERLHEARELLVDVFTSEEPVSVALGLSRDDNCKMYPMDNMQLSCFKYPVSVVAVTASNEIIGVLFADGMFPSSIETEVPPSLEPWTALSDSLVSCIDMSDPTDKLAYGITVAVKKTRGGEGIAKALAIESVRLAKKNGYKYCIVLSTSTYSLKIGLKLGFQVKAFKKYQEFEYNGQKPFMNINPKHEGARLLVLSLDHFPQSKL